MNRLWKTNRFKAKFNNLVTRDGYVYGLDDGRAHLGRYHQNWQAGSRQNSQAGGLRYIAQPSRLRVRGASQPHVPSHRQPTDGGCNKMRLLRRLHDSKPGKMRLGPDAWRRKVPSMSPMEKTLYEEDHE